MKTIDNTGVPPKPVLLVANPNGKVIGPALPGDGRELRTFQYRLTDDDLLKLEGPDV